MTLDSSVRPSPAVRQQRRRPRPGWSRPARFGTLLLALTLTTVGLLGVSPQRAAAAVIRNFAPLFSTQTNGEIFITGNALETCDITVANCAAALAGTNTSYGNNNFTMKLLDADDDTSTKASSGATVRIPDGSTVLYAGLFWGAAVTAGQNGVAATSTAYNQIRLRVPGAAAYQTVTADRAPDRLTNQGQDYSSYADITDLVQANGAGQYFGADIPEATGVDRYGGWSIVVAYSNPTLPLRDLNVFGGYASVQNSDVVKTSISGFLTPTDGTVNARFGSVVYEGDQQLTGDYFAVNGTRLADAQSRSANFFASRITNGGTNLTDRTPNTVNSMALDAKVVDAPNVLDNKATSADLTFGTSGDFYYPAALTTQIDLYAPVITGTKSVVDLNGNSPAQVGDVLEYTVSLSNSGQDPATNAVLSDTVPAGTSYLPGSMRVVSGANTGAKTDDAGDDQAEVNGNQLTYRLGTGADAKTGGTLNQSDSTSLRFRVRVLPAAAGGAVTNTAALAYTAATLGKPFSYKTNSVRTPVATAADLSLTKTGPATISAGGGVSYQLTAANSGPSTARNVRLIDTLPDGFTLTSTNGAACTLSGRTLTCTAAALASGSSLPVTVTGQLDPDDSADSLVNTASVDSDTSDPDRSNNTAATTAQLTRSADLGLAKTVSPRNPVPGQTVTWTLAARNSGPSTATGVRISDTLPAGLTVTGASADQGDCTVNGNAVACSDGDLAPGGTATVTIVSRLDAGLTSADPLRNAGYVQSSTPDPDTTNNADAAEIDPADPSADLAIAKQTLSNPVRAGLPVSYRLTVTNRGPSVARDVVVTDAGAAQLSGLSGNPAAGSCDAGNGRTVRCTVGDLTPGGSTTVTVQGVVANSATGQLTNSAAVSSATTDPNPDDNQATVTDPIVTRADLSLVKTAAPSPAVAGGDVTYTLAVHNAGRSDAQDVTVTDEIPAPLVPGTARSADGTCTVTDRTVSCDLGTVPNDGDATVTVTASVPDDANPGDISNTASVASSTPDPDTSNNTASTTLSTDRSADVSVTKVGPGTLTAGTQGTWTLTAHNDGPSAGTGVVLSDVLPDDLTGISVDAADSSNCTVTGQRVQCAIGDLDPGTDVPVRVLATLIPDPAHRTLVNVATVDSDGPDPTASNNSSASRTQVVRSADLALAKRGPGAVLAGDRIAWTLALTNTGPSTALNAVIVDTLPAGLTGLQVPDSCTVDGSTLTCPVGSLTPGDEADVAVSGVVPSGTPVGSTVVNRAGSTSDVQDPNPDNDNATVSTTVQAQANLAIAKTVSPSPLTAGAIGTYRLTATDNGPSDATAVRITDRLPDSVTPLSVQGQGCAIDGQTVSCALDRLAAGAGAQVEITVRVAAGRIDPVDNTAAVGSDTPDPDQGDNTATVTAPVIQQADVVAAKVADRSTLAAGEAVTYTLTASNAGPSPARNVVLTDPVPTGTEVVTAAAGCQVQGTNVSCAAGDLAAGASASFPVTVRFPAGQAAGDVTNTVTASSNTTDPDPDNNAASATVTIVQRADLSVSKSVTPAVLVPGEAATFTIVVGNTGPSRAYNVVLTDTVPASLQVLSATEADGTPCTVDGQQVSCRYDQLTRAQTVVTVKTKVPPGFTGNAVTNTTEVTSDTTDPDATNNTASVSAPVVPQADLQINKTVDPNPATPGDKVTFTMTSTNRGPSTASAVAINDLLPYGLVEPTASATDGGTCTITPRPDDGELGPNSGQLRCLYGNVAVGDSVSVSVTAGLRSDLTGTLANTASTGSTTLDPASANNEATVEAALSPSADLVMSKTIDPAAPVPGAQVSFQLGVANRGPSVATGVSIVDQLPPGLSDVVLTPSDGGTCTFEAPPQGSPPDGSSGEVRCTFASVSDGEGVRASVAITATLNAAATGGLTNTATVSADTPDPVSGNNAATAEGTISPAADLAVTKQLTPATPVPGQPVSYRIVGTNRGPSLASAATIKDLLPAGLEDVEVTQTDGATCTVAPATDVSTPNSGRLSCDLGDLAVGATQSVTITADVRPDLTGELTNVAVISSDTRDPVSGNNRATAAGTLQPVTDVAIVKELEGPAVAGGEVSWDLVVGNIGPSTATDVRLSDPVPTSVSALRVSADGSACDLVGQQLSCRWASLEPGETHLIRLSGTLAADATGTLVNSASVATLSGDDDSSDDTSTAQGVISRTAPSPSPSPSPSPTPPPNPSPSPSPAPTAPAASTPPTLPGPLAATGSTVSVLVVGAALAAVIAGAVLLGLSRRRRAG